MPTNDHALTGFDSPRILIVGAGPVGLFLALKLAQSGINSTVIEKEDSTSKLPRACGHAGIVQHEFAKIGIYDKIKAMGGFISVGPCWRKPLIDNDSGGKDLGEMVANFKKHKTVDPSMPPGSGTLHFPQAKLSELLLKEAVSTGRVEVRFNSDLESIQDNIDDTVSITVKDMTTGSSFSLSGTYLVGADGATSKTRKLLDIPFAGYTWDRKLLATDVLIYNQPGEESPHPTSFIMDETHFGVITPLMEPKQGTRSLWRYTIGLPVNDPRSNDELLGPEYVESIYENYMPGPRPLDYEITNKSIYSIHQRLASTMRRGRVLLAGDAAHICNPFGGLGLNTGFLDVMALHDSLVMILKEGYSDELLDIYSDERRRSFQMFVDPMSTYNLLRVISKDAEKTTEDDWYFRALKNGNRRVLKSLEKQVSENWATDMRAILRADGDEMQL
ncbi:uncharacterized protein N7483_003117 [Penicillium malachiteum]|uniref:uncharacterized protein n=1 Tax=Penicillium malachiteum TaxID=1324776 RepID=UPI0025477794|nr:uncharacterized protein N7483_003117 [Penicillium malachiteum]KAJ5728609.1 hypothetical protein N7483_003117 [Penicillium malachiteum]